MSATSGERVEPADGPFREPNRGKQVAGAGPRVQPLDPDRSGPSPFGGRHPRDASWAGAVQLQVEVPRVRRGVPPEPGLDPPAGPRAVTRRRVVVGSLRLPPRSGRASGSASSARERRRWEVPLGTIGSTVRVRFKNSSADAERPRSQGRRRERRFGGQSDGRSVRSWAVPRERKRLAAGGAE